MKPHLEGLTVGLALALGVVSLYIWISILRVWWREGTVLPFEPRRRVPWGPVGLVIAGFFIADKVQGLLAGEPPEIPPDHAVSALLQWAAFEVIAVVAGCMLLRRVSRASWHDLGVPGGLRDGMDDAVLGAVAALASLAPVYILLNIFVVLFGPIPQNPLLDRLFEEPSAALLVGTAVSAVIAAPLFEEFVFRLLIQGWLEKIFMSPEAFDDPPEQTGQTHDGGPSGVATDEAAYPSESPADDPAVGRFESRKDGSARAAPGGVHVRISWPPIVISSVLFAAAHLGYGYSPVPLFLLALILGYIYQRTHRIVPCIVAHMAFNGISVAMAGLEIFGKPAVPA